MIKRNFTLLKWYNFFEDFRFYAGFIILYFAQVAGSYTLGMTVFGLGFLFQSLFEVPAGVVSDKFLHRKYSLAAAAIVDFCAVACYALACDARLLVAGAACEGLSRALTSGTDTAFLYETLKSGGKTDEFETYQGKAASMFQTALFLGALLGALAVLKSYRFAYLLTLAPKFCQIVVSLFFVEPPCAEKSENVFAHLKEAFAAFKKEKSLRLFALATIVDDGVGEACYQFKAAFVRQIIPDWAVSLLSSANNLLAGISFWFAGKIIRKTGYLKLFFGGEVLNLLIGASAVLLKNIASPFLFVSTSVLYGPMSTAGVNLCQRRFTDAQRATMQSLISLAGSLFLCLASVLVGALADATSPTVALFAGVLAPKFVTLPVYFALFRKRA